MEELDIRLVTKDVGNKPFDCGVGSINSYVLESYYPSIIQHAYTYCLKYNDLVLGYYQVLFRDILLDYFPDEVSEYDAGLKDGKITAVHIRFIAIDKQYQHNNLGTNVLRIVIKQVIELSKKWPIRVITIDAINTLVKWYEREGFRKMVENTPGQDDVTEAMYFDCMLYSDELERYVSEV